ncbi:hypothetical protein YC2023_011567 [Brassica napus]
MVDAFTTPRPLPSMFETINGDLRKDWNKEKFKGIDKDMSHGGELSRETRTANKRSGERSLPYRSQRPRDNEEKKIDGFSYIPVLAETLQNRRRSRAIGFAIQNGIANELPLNVISLDHSIGMGYPRLIKRNKRIYSTI